MFIQFLFILFFLVFVSSGYAVETDSDKNDSSRADFYEVSFYRESNEIAVKRLLKNGDFDGALDACRKALRTRENDPDLNREFTELRQIIRLRREFTETKSSVRKTLLGDQLRCYYIRNEIHDENIAMAVDAFCENRTPGKALKLTEALTVAGRHQDALDFIDSLDLEKNADQLLVEKVRILLDADRWEEAITVLRSLTTELIDSPELLLSLARLQAMTKQNVSAVKTLGRCFGLIRQNQLAEVKRHVMDDPAFQAIRSTSEFGAVMQIRSKEPPCGKPCSQKWVGTVFNQEPEYMRKNKLGEKIDLNFWRVY